MKKLVVLTGAGISAESGIRTFRDSDGLWHDYDIMEVASPEGWRRDPKLVLNFYNERRRAFTKPSPTLPIWRLPKRMRNSMYTSSPRTSTTYTSVQAAPRLWHLHGELKKARSTADPSLIYDIEGTELNWGDECELGSQLRPHIVWFGEAVPAMSEAAEIAHTADVFAVVGSSLVVYPAAALVQFVPSSTPVFVVDPKEVAVPSWREITFIRDKATRGVPKMLEAIRNLS